MDVKLPDGTVVQNVPDGMSKADFTAKLKANGYDVSKLEAPAAAPAPEPSMMEKAATLTGQYGIAAPIVGAARTAMGGISEASDIAGSAVTEGASRAGLSPEVSAGLGTAANIASGTVIAGGAGKAATGAAPIMESAARRLMQSSIKPNLAARTSGQADKAITTMLDKGINATEGGMEATQGRVTELEKTIQDVLEKSPATVNKFEVAKSLKTAVEDTKLKLGRAKNLDDIQQAYSDFWNHDAIKGLSDIPVALANKMKQAFYKELSEKAYQPGANLGSYEKAEKALASGLRSEVAKAEPSIVPSMKEQSELLNVLKVAGPQVGREGNKNIIGLGVLSPTMERTMVWMLDRYPWFKSMMARGLYQGQERIPQALVGTGTAAVEAAQTRK